MTLLDMELPSASCIASDGIIDFPIFDTRITEEIENNKTVRLKGAAPDVKIIAHKAFQLSEFIIGWHWTAGHKLQEVNGQVIWIQENENLVQISSNSWGNGAVVPDDYMKGFDPYSMLLDLYSMEGDGELLYDNYPGVIFVVSAGNGAQDLVQLQHLRLQQWLLLWVHRHIITL